MWLPGPLPPLAIPATLHDALLARLDRPGGGKSRGQLGATSGARLPMTWCGRRAPGHPATLQAALVAIGGCRGRDAARILPQATYTFKHALIQDAAYQSAAPQHNGSSTINKLPRC